MELDDQNHPFQGDENELEIDVVTDSDTPFDPLMDHLFYTRSPSLEPQYMHTASHYLYNQQCQTIQEPWLVSPQSVRRQVFPIRPSSNSCSKDIPRLRDLPRSAVAQRILKEKAAAANEDIPIDKQTPPIPESSDDSQVKITIENCQVDIVEKTEEAKMVEVTESHRLTQTPSQKKLEEILVSPQGILSSSQPCETLVEQAFVGQELKRLFPTLETLTVLPVNTYSSICEKTTVMVQRVHEFARTINESLGSLSHGTPFDQPDRLTAAILGLNWRAVKKAVEKTRTMPGSLPPCKAQQRPQERNSTKGNRRSTIPIEKRIAVVKDYIVNRLTQSSCATKYGVKLSYVQYIVKRFRNTGVLHGEDTDVDQDLLPRESCGTIREFALIRRLNDIPDPQIMLDKSKELENEEKDNEEDEVLSKKKKRGRPGRKRKIYSSGEESEILLKKDTKDTVWSDIEDEDNTEISPNEDKENEEVKDDVSFDSGTSGTVDRLIICEDNSSMDTAIDPEDEDVNVMDTSHEEEE